MPALSVPVSPLPLPGNLPAQSVSGADQSAPEQTPFASVLQQKVQDNNAAKDNQSNANPQQAAKAENAPQASNGTPESGNATPQNSAQTETAQAPGAKEIALAGGDVAADMLQNLLPWMASLQAAQAQAGAAVAADTTVSSDTAAAVDPLLAATDQAVLPVMMQTTTVSAAPTQTAKADVSDRSAGLQLGLESGNQQASAGHEAASAAANLAVTTDTSAVPGKTTLDAGQQQISFDAALTSARDQIAAQTQANTVAHHAEPVRINAALGTPRWQNEVGDQIRWMSTQNESKAELILTPPQLGRIEISLNINGDQANAMFVSANPQVREALEGSIERLREVLAQSGIALGQAQVGAESFSQAAGQQGANGGSSGRAHADSGASGNETAPLATANWTRGSNNMLDVFA